MTHDELNAIEQALGIVLPANYKDWALSLPAVGDEGDGICALFNDFEYLIEVNLGLRKKGCQEEEWPLFLYSIGDPDGDPFFIDLREGGKTVYYANHDAGPYFDPNQIAGCFCAEAADFYRENFGGAF